ncbi:hypothetical protein B0H10DRAFT_2132829 [Mycena sp. CBHHK59/15]|nr:hypothetical protein B0H10DRAFT_2132829 [Mycena sp. CBHHK59/15]
MPDEVLQRIIDCSHFHKITSAADLVRETRWHRVVEDGDRVLSLISTHKPVPPPEPLVFNAPLRALDTNSAASTPKISKAPRQCRACFQLGHIASNRMCPKYQARSTPRARQVAVRQDENAAPQTSPFSFNPTAMAVPIRRSPRSPPAAGPSTSIAINVPQPCPCPLQKSPSPENTLPSSSSTAPIPISLPITPSHTSLLSPTQFYGN